MVLAIKGMASKANVSVLSKVWQGELKHAIKGASKWRIALKR